MRGTSLDLTGGKLYYSSSPEKYMICYGCGWSICMIYDNCGIDPCMTYHEELACTIMEAEKFHALFFATQRQRSPIV